MIRDIKHISNKNKQNAAKDSWKINVSQRIKMTGEGGL